MDLKSSLGTDLLILFQESLFLNDIWHGFYNLIINFNMNKLVRGLIAGYGAKKLGGGCLTTVLLFIIIYYALGQCN